MNPETKAIIESLINAPLLIGSLPAAPVFDRSLLKKPENYSTLKFDQKLGHLYEQALQQLIDSSPSLECLASHLQVLDENKRTLGELDFILFDRINHRHIHLELAVKFYLAVKENDGWNFPGPDPNDNWQQKLDRLQNHQLRLSDRPETKKLFRDRFDIDTIETHQLIYGCLFHPLEYAESPRLEFMAPDGRIGHWLYTSQWREHFSGNDEIFLIPKPLWPVKPAAQIKKLLQPVTVNRLITLASDRCTMFTFTNSSKSWFLVPDEWR